MKMRKLIFIGTLHARLTPKTELFSVLDEYDFDLILIEVQQSDLDSNNLDRYPPEMLDAFSYAKSKGIKVKGFDCGFNVILKGKSDDDNLAVIEEQKKLLAGLNWKDFNKEINLKLIDIKSENDLIDQEKWDERENLMMENIEKELIDGTVIIITGAGHLKYFEKYFKDAEFPFR